MILYIVTTHGHLEGARLSKRGHWGNLPYDSVDDAAKAAKLDAKGERFKLERKDFPALPTFTTRHPLD